MDVKKIQAKRFVVVKADGTFADDYHFMDKTEPYRIIVDTKTGVNYLVLGNNDHSFGKTPATSITPILDSDGKPLIDFWGLPKT